MLPNANVTKVFDGIDALSDGGRAVANAVITAADTFNNIANGTPQQPSRRDFGSAYGTGGYQQAPQQPVQYQPSPYPWASSPQTQYGYGYSPQNKVYDGIANPNYGKPGFFNGGQYWYNNPNMPAFNTGQINTSGNWFDRVIWG